MSVLSTSPTRPPSPPQDSQSRYPVPSQMSHSSNIDLPSFTQTHRVQRCPLFWEQQSAAAFTPHPASFQHHCFHVFFVLLGVVLPPLTHVFDFGVSTLATLTGPGASHSTVQWSNRRTGRPALVDLDRMFGFEFSATIRTLHTTTFRVRRCRKRHGNSWVPT
jgi:hypothetical protein